MDLKEDELLRLNRDYLKSLSKKALQDMVKGLGKSIKNKNKNEKNKYLYSEQLVDIIILEPAYVMKNKEFFDNLEKEKKLEYYKKLKIRLYSNCIEKENKYYDKPCLEFQTLHRTGYGNIGGYGKKTLLTHVVSFAISKNIYVEDIKRKNEKGEKLEICHGRGCSKACIEPTHLSLKTKIENLTTDMIRDGTALMGSNHPSASIDDETAMKIKHSKGDGRTREQRAKDYKVSTSLVASIDNGTGWTHIPDKDGNINILNNENKKQKNRERRKNNKGAEITSDEYKIILKRIKEKTNEVSAGFETPCWLCKGLLTNGYGTISYKSVKYYIHVLAYEASLGKKIDLSGDKKYICHRCNNKSCCNPEHLYFGSPRENNIDAINNGSKIAKLNIEKVKEIRKQIEQGVAIKDIALKNGLTTAAIYDIKTRSSWWWV